MDRIKSRLSRFLQEIQSAEDLMPLNCEQAKSFLDKLRDLKKETMKEFSMDSAFSDIEIEVSGNMLEPKEAKT